MRVALIGATGRVGTRVTPELMSRGHEVTGLARHANPSQPYGGTRFLQGDVQDEAAMSTLLAGHDAVIHSVRFVNTNPSKIVAAMKKARVPRLLVVGGAGSLEVAPGVALVDTPQFPAEYKPEALAARDFLNALRSEKELAWTFLSPAAILEPGERTGHFRVGKDQLLVAAGGQSRISMEDYAIALVNELERPQHIRERFTVAY